MLDRHGVWKRAGMSAMITGLDMIEAMASLPAGCDADFARELFVIAEAEFMAAMIERQAQDKEQEQDKDESASDHG